jgi:type II restriction/modification system DNA methylase subunit YeeA
VGPAAGFIASGSRELTPQTFIAKWGTGGPGHSLNERQGAQQHFIELCALLGVASPTGGDDYLFEKGTLALGYKRGFADVFKRGAFAWEYKAPGRPLDAALSQLMRYALALDNPPLLVVSDRLRIEIHTHFNGTPSERHVVELHDLGDPAKRELLRRAFDAPDSFRPKRTNRQITEQAAHAFATTAERLRGAGHTPEAVSHFLTQCLFCFFAEDVGLLPARLFEKLVGVRTDPDRLRAGLQQLFNTMQGGGLFGADDIPWFNGGLFQTIAVPPLAEMDVTALRNAAALDWSAIDPSIFGTLFERGLDPAKRSQLGAHYTDPATIERLIDPVIRRPLRAEWEAIKPRIAAKLAKSKRADDKAWREARAEFVAYLERLRAYRVLDPACGSGNFLYLALKCLKDLEHQANLEAEALGLQREVDSYTSPANVLGIELNEYAAELARVTVWIGELQWRLQQGYPFKVNPVLEPLDHIACRDALLNVDGSEAAWPTADAVVGNPPFVGDKKMRAELGDTYTETLRATFKGRVPGGADLVCYWFEKARAQIEAGALQRAGLVATNSIRGGKNRGVLDRVTASTRIFEAWSDEPWVNDGAAVRVSLIAFGATAEVRHIDGSPVAAIQSDLSAAARDLGDSLDLALARTLATNVGISFIGTQKGGSFDVPEAEAKAWLALPNPHGRSNATVLSPWINGLDITRRPQGYWLIDFVSMPEAEAALFDAPWRHVERHVRSKRVGNREARSEEAWWLLQRRRPEMKQAVKSLPFYIATARVAKHRLFAKVSGGVTADSQVVVFARADDTTLGVLHSRFHELWSLRMCTWMGKGNDPRYTPTTCFETFAFPAGLTPADTAHQRTEVLDGGALIPAGLPAPVRHHAEAIASAAKALNDLRERWLNPPEWTDRVPEVVPLGMSASPYPDRIVAKPGFEKLLSARTLTKLYNERPAWLAQAHDRLDAAVAAAYGWADWTPAMADEEVLRRLLALNRERAAPAA